MTLVLNSKLTLNSQNKKTGSIAVSTTSRHTCPESCPFRSGEGCYADGYHTSLQWNRVTRGDSGESPDAFITRIRNLPRNEMFRHNVAGDLWPDLVYPRQIDQDAVSRLSDAASHLYASWTYTHHTLDGIDGAINKSFILENNLRNRFIINLSTESIATAARLHKQGFAVTVVQPEGLPTAFRHDDVSFVQCPATLPNSNITCKTCGGRRNKPLCARGDRNVVVVFPAHGQRKVKAAAHCS